MCTICALKLKYQTSDEMMIWCCRYCGDMPHRTSETKYQAQTIYIYNRYSILFSYQYRQCCIFDVPIFWRSPQERKTCGADIYIRTTRSVEIDIYLYTTLPQRFFHTTTRWITWCDIICIHSFIYIYVYIYIKKNYFRSIMYHIIRLMEIFTCIAHEISSDSQIQIHNVSMYVYTRTTYASWASDRHNKDWSIHSPTCFSRHTWQYLHIETWLLFLYQVRHGNPVSSRRWRRSNSKVTLYNGATTILILLTIIFVLCIVHSSSSTWKNPSWWHGRSVHENHAK